MRDYASQMRLYQKDRIIRRSGFLYLPDAGKIRFRKQGELKRRIRRITLEMLAGGMLEILRLIRWYSR